MINLIFGGMMKLSKKAIIAILCLTTYIGVGYASQWSTIPQHIRHMLMSLQFIMAGFAFISLIAYAGRSAWINRRLESFLLLFLSVSVSIFLIPAYARLSYHFAQLAVRSVSENVEKKNQSHDQHITCITTKDGYNQFLADNKERLVIIKASAEWCPPCQQLKLIYQEIASELADKIKCAEVDVDSFDDRSALTVNSLPTLLLYKNGQEISRIVGYRTKEHLIDEFKKLM
jgi:thioredoxin 1